jgi:hypothetical protein
MIVCGKFYSAKRGEENGKTAQKGLGEGNSNLEDTREELGSRQDDGKS